jgi:UDP-2-acetamido-3-amino-2,3-dideoxy-glucuronate N-acetyltransferase
MFAAPQKRRALFDTTAADAAPKGLPMTPVTPGIAVIGSGYWGKNLVRVFHQAGALRLVCDKNGAVLAGFQKTYPGLEVSLALHEALSRSDVAGVAIATPAETHYTLAKEALLAGKHVFVEKPLVLHEIEAKDLIALAKERGLVLMVGHLLQYHPVFLLLKDLVSSGALGKIDYIYSQRLNLGKIRREENILWSFAPHDISMILALAGELPETVLATGGNYLHKKIADVTTTHLEFPSGLKAHVFVSWLHPFKEQKLVVVGEKKMAVFDDTQPWDKKLALYAHQILWENNVPVPAKADPEYPVAPQGEPLGAECAHFLECVREKKTPRTDGKEGLAVLAVLNAAQKSMNEGGAPRAFSLAAPGETAEKAQPRFSVHETAVVDDNVTIGEGTKIWHFTHVLSGSVLGEKVNVGQNVVIGPDVTIGNGCKVQNNVSVYKGVTLEDDVFCGPSMVFTNVYNPRANIRKMDEARKTLVKKGATLGANCTIVCGTTIGEHAFVGAGAVVCRDVPAHALVVGNPARQIGWACECGTTLNQECQCPACGRQYAFGPVSGY